MNEEDEVLRHLKVQLEQIERILAGPNCNPATPYARRLIEREQLLQSEIANCERLQEARRSSAARAVPKQFNVGNSEGATERKMPNETQPEADRVSRGKYRASRVAQFIKELGVLRHEIYGSEKDLENAKNKHSDFAVFAIAQSRQDLHAKLLSIGGHRQHIRFAKELAAAECGGIALATIEDAWKDFKPEEFRKRKR